MDVTLLRNDLVAYYRSKQGQAETVSVAIGLLGVATRFRSAVILSMAVFRLFINPLRVVTGWQTNERLDEHINHQDASPLYEELRKLRTRLDELTTMFDDDKRQTQYDVQSTQSATQRAIEALVERLDAIESRDSRDDL